MNSKYTGAGIIPIIIYNKIPYFILFSSGKGIISDAGGTIENKDNLEDSAIRELFEESCGIIKISKNDLLKNSVYIDIINNHDKQLYRSHIIFINKIDLSDLLNYYTNLKKFKKFDRNPFTETYGIHLIKIEWIHYYNNDIYMNTHTDKIKLLNNRLKIIMKNIMNKFGNLDNFYDIVNKKIKKINLKQKKINIDTYSYKNNNKIYVDDVITYTS